MTMIKFNYNDSYGQPSRGSLAFMPHRRHAANETEILPKPFTVPLLNGEAQVNLQPNSSSWVWIITEYFENVAKSFYTTIPDSDGIIEHTELVHINPSSIPAAYDSVEPAWWAEMRQYKQTVGETLLKSTEALDEATTAIETGRESVEQTRNNASLAKAYSEESREHSYASRDYRDEAKTWRDEAQEQADRAASGPESAAARAEAAATRSETARDRAIAAEDESRNSAAEARADATTAQTAASNAVTARTQAQAEADRSTTEADRAKGYADDLLNEPTNLVQQAQNAVTTTQTLHDTVATLRQEVANDKTTVENHRDIIDDTANVISGYKTEVEEHLQTINTAIAESLKPGEWASPTLENDFKAYNRFSVRVLPDGNVQFNGSLENGTRTANTRICNLDGIVEPPNMTQYINASIGSNTLYKLSWNTYNNITVINSTTETGVIRVNDIVPIV